MTDFLEEFRRELDSVAHGDMGGSIELLARSLSPEAEHLFRLIAIPHQFTFELLSILDPTLTNADVDSIGTELMKLSVVTHGESAVALHDDVRLYLFRQWLTKPKRSEFRSASTRLRDYFKGQLDSDGSNVSVMGRYRVMFHSIGADREEGFDDFIQLIRRGRRENRLDDCQKILQLVQEYDDWWNPTQRGWIKYQDAKLNLDREKPTAAVALFTSILEDADLPVALRVKALTRNGIALRKLAEWDKAIGSFRTANQIVSEDKNVARERGWILHEWALALQDKGDLSGSERLLIESVGCAEQEDSWVGMAAGYNSLGTLYRSRGNAKAAIGSYKTALQQLEENGEIFRSAQVHNNVGMALADAGQWQESLFHLEKSLEIKKRSGDTRGMANSQSNLMRTYWNLGMRADSNSAANEAAHRYLTLDDIESAAIITRNLARLERSAGEHKSAEENYRRAIELFDQAGKERAAREAEQELKTHSVRTTPRMVTCLVVTLAILFGATGLGALVYWLLEVLD